MATTLATYLTATRRLLHDANSNFYTDSQLTDYINSARDRVVGDTGCNRKLLTLNLTTPVEVYTFPTPVTGKAVIDVLNITFLWGSQRVPLGYMPFTEFNRNMRVWQTFVARPTFFSVYGQNSVYIGPVPDQTYVAEWDCVVTAADLVNPTDVETIAYPYTDPVPYYAAGLGKEFDQAIQESERFRELYNRSVLRALRSSFTRRLPMP